MIPQRPSAPAGKPQDVLRRVFVLVACFFTLSASALASAPADGVELPLERTAGWVVQSNGRLRPLETHARELVLAVTGKTSIDGLSAMQVFWGYNLDGQSFREREYIRLDSKILKQAMGVDVAQRRFSFDDLMQSAELRELVEEARSLEEHDGVLGTLQTDALAAYAKMELVAGLIQGHQLLVVPGESPADPWAAPLELHGLSDPAKKDVYDGLVRLATAYATRDTAAFSRSSDALTLSLRRLSPGGAYPTDQEIDLELFYNRLGAFGKAWGAYLMSFCVLLFFGEGKRRWGYLLGMGLLVIGLFLHTAGIGLRWSIAGRAPVSDMYESLVFMAWGSVAIGLALECIYRKGQFALAANLVAFIVLLFSQNLPIDSAVNPLVPVLANTSWLSIHVMTIMLSYSAFALTMVMGHAILVLQLFRPGKTETLHSTSHLLYRTTQVGLLFLAAGICFGAIWANRSWGRYWGWDPKETWSLITFFAYLGLVHARFAGWLHHFGSAVWSILCFLCVVMTYYGVNFILGTGMHSYGFGSGGTGYALAYLVIELAIIGAATWRYRSMLGQSPHGAPVSAGL